MAKQYKTERYSRASIKAQPEAREPVNAMPTWDGKKPVKQCSEEWLDRELVFASESPAYAAKIFAAMLTGRGFDRFELLTVKTSVLKAMPYSRYLQTPHWKQVSAACKARAKGRCQVCNSDGELHAHHRTYERRGHEDDADLIALCATCHSIFHERDRLKHEDEGMPLPSVEGVELSAVAARRRKELGIETEEDSQRVDAIQALMEAAK